MSREPGFNRGARERMEIPAVILAAGAGRRLLAGGAKRPKPLTPILGLSMLERSILTCREAGVREFFIVVGHRRDEIIPHIEQLGRRHSIDVRVVVNSDWRAGNGSSVLACAPYISGPFLVIMCDHIFDPEILALLLEEEDGGDVCRMAIDRRTEQVFDSEDATRVRLEGDRITAIGKEIEDFEAIDTGLFLCRPIIFEAIKTSNSNGDGAFSSGIRQLIRMQKIRAVDIGDRFWLDVDTPASLAHAESLLVAGLEKQREDGYVSRFINRPLSRWITRLLVKTPITPNAITTFSFLAAVIGAYCFSMGQYAWSVLAGVLVQMASIVDGCDGEIARLKFRANAFGGWLDTVLDRYADASYSKKEYTIRYSARPPGGVIEKLIKRDLRIFAILLAALANRPFEGLVLLGLLSHFGILWLFLTAPKKVRESR